MAKKNEKSTTSTSKSTNSVFDMVMQMDSNTEILSNAWISTINEWIPTGSYILNACLSGSIFRGIPNRVVTFAGDPGSGKSFLMASIVREAQKKGYSAIVIDTEFALDSDFYRRIGADPDKVLIKQTCNISEMSEFVLNFITAYEAKGEEYRKKNKVILVLDSLTNLSTDAMTKNIQEGDIAKQDFTKQKGFKTFFSTVTVPLGRCGVPFLISSHVYASMDYISTNKASGGQGMKYNSSIIAQLSAAKLDGTNSANDKIAKSKSGDLVKTGVIVTVKPEKSRFSKPIKVRFHIPFFTSPNPYIGLEAYMGWDICGIDRGNIYNESEFSKLSASDQNECQPFKYINKETSEEETLYFYKKATARGIAVAHLGRTVPLNKFYTPEVFTDEILKLLDDKVIRPLFELPSTSSDTFETGEEYLDDVVTQ